MRQAAMRAAGGDRRPALAAAILLAALAACAQAPADRGRQVAAPSPEERLEEVVQEFRTAPGGGSEAPRSDLVQIDESARAKRELLARAHQLEARQDEEFAKLSEDPKARRAWAQKQRPVAVSTAGVLEHYIYARALFLIGESSQTLHQIQLALSHAGDFAPARALLGFYHFREERWEDARKELEAARRLDSSDDKVWILLAYAYQKLDRIEEARRLMSTALASGRCEVAAARWLANYYAERGEIAEVVRLLEPAVERDGANADLRAILGNAYAALGRNEAAVDQLEKAMVGLERGWDQALRLAELQRRAGRYGVAEKGLVRILEQAPESFFADLPRGRANVEELLDHVREEARAGRRLYYSVDEDVAILRGSSDAEERYESARRLLPRLAKGDRRFFAEMVTTFLRDDDARIKRLGIRILASSVDGHDVPGVFKILREMATMLELDPAVRVTACRALGMIHTPASARVLLECLRQSEAEVFHAAREGLQHVTGKSPLVIGGGEELNEDLPGRLKVFEQWKIRVEGWCAEREKKQVR